MSSGKSAFSSAADKEVAALIATLHQTEQRLEELTGGEIDAVVRGDGTTFLLQRAQEELRLHEAARQAAILNALPAHIALVDNRGVIVSVNRTWREFAEANALPGPGQGGGTRTGIGTNYLDVCEKARQSSVTDGGVACDGIRSVLARKSSSFSMEYACHSSTQQRWFLMTATPLSDTAANGAVIMHLNITAERKAKADLIASELQFRQMAESVGDSFTLRELDSRMIYVNPAYEAIWGRSCASLYAKPDSWLDAVHPDDLNAVVWKDSHGAMLPRYELEFRIMRPDGSIRWIEARRFPVHDDAGIIVRVASVAKDITARKQAEIEMKRLNRVYAVLSEINALIVRVRDRDELFREACRIAVDTGGFGMAMIGIVDRATNKVVPVASAGKDEEFLTVIRNLLSSDEKASTTMVGKAIRDKTAIVSNDSEGDPRVLLRENYTRAGVRSLAVLPLIVSGEAVGILALYAKERDFFHEEEMKRLTDLTDDVAFAIDHIGKEERLNYLAYYDPTTGLANRTLFLERLHKKLLSSQPDSCGEAVFILDIERFKTINDTFGQKAGDDLLKQIAERLVQSGGGDASRFARLGADQFAIFASNMDNAEKVGRYVEQRLSATFTGSFRIRDNDLHVPVKVGIALFPDDGWDAETLLRNAEAALKKAKGTGDRYLFFTKAMTERVAERLSLEHRLRQAIDNEEFVLHYQPKVSLASSKLSGIEALIRWNDPLTGLVPPFQFIPILEETGLIREVGRWALRKAIADYVRWRDAELSVVRIAVNVSALQLRSRDFVAEIEQAIGISAHAAAGLELEITESMIMGDMKQAVATLHAIRALGVSIAIDDFGTGFSSLGYLSKLPVDTLKIDRSFVNDMTVDSQGMALVSTIINLAHSLHLKVVAEGVETEEQARLLRLLLCDEMQGYLYSKPVPVDVLEEKFLVRLPQA